MAKITTEQHQSQNQEPRGGTSYMASGENQRFFPRDESYEVTILLSRKQQFGYDTLKMPPLPRRRRNPLHSNEIPNMFPFPCVIPHL